MSNPIGYVDMTWNPLAMRCTPAGEGCRHCWHLKFATRHAANGQMPERKRASWAGGKPTLSLKDLTAPTRWKKPRRVAVQFMGDLFHEKVGFHDVADILEVICDERCEDHRFFILTKRPRRMLEFFRGYCGEYPIGEALGATLEVLGKIPNLWVGVSVWDQASADEMVPPLLDCYAAHKWVSVEPMLGRVDLSCVGGTKDSDGAWGINALARRAASLDWVVCGAETGPGKRPMDIDWARQLKNKCRAYKVPFWFKKDSGGSHDLDGMVYEEMP